MDYPPRMSPWFRRRRPTGAEGIPEIGSPELEATLERIADGDPDDPSDGSIAAGRESGEIVIVDTRYADDDGIHLHLERYAQVDGGTSAVCATEAELVDAFLEAGANPTSAQQSARIIWRRLGRRSGG